MESKNMPHALLQLFESAVDEDFWRSESGIAEAYAKYNNGEQLRCEMKSTAITEAADSKDMELSILLGNKEYKVSIRVHDIETGRQLHESEF
jgi:hypothetical protein